MPTWNPHDYHNNSSQQQIWARELIAKLHLHGDERVLDIGCGDGKVTAEIASLLPRGCIVGIDKSPDMIQFATRNFPSQEFPNLSFEQMDASTLRFRDEFDVIFSNAALHWIYDHRPVLHGISAALKPTGRILLQMGGSGNAAGVLATVSSIMREPEWSPYFENFTFRYGFHGPADYQQWLTSAGLQPHRVELIPKDMIHPTIDAFTGWLRTTWIPWIQSVPESRREEFIHHLVEHYVKSHPPDSAGRVHVEMVRLEVEAYQHGRTER
jgi:trans-aconitate methyltransferase